MNTAMATDEVIDIIASIEMQRREVERETGGAAACGGALRRLQELFDRETEALRLYGPGTQYPANIAAVTAEIGKVKRLIEDAGRLSLPKGARIVQRDVLQRGSPLGRSRNRSRRARGRSGGR